MGTLSLACALASAQEQTLSQFLRTALDASPDYRAASARLDAGRLTYESLRAGHNTVLEVAPGLGFTNSNVLIGQRFDLSGGRAAQARVAQSLFQVVRSENDLVRAHVIKEALVALAEVWWAESLVASRTESVRITEATLSGMTRRVEIGEAPEVQKIRAAIEVDRAKQSLASAEGQLGQARAALKSLVGTPSGVRRLALMSGAPSLEQSIEAAIANRPETKSSQARIYAAQGEVGIAQSLGRPDVVFGVAADVWSLDRDPFNRNGFGLQLSFSMPLFDRGEVRKSVAAARSRTLAERAEADSVLRRIKLETEQAAMSLASARSVSEQYESRLVPQARDLVQRYLAGLDAGLVDFLEVLEAQRTLSQIETEAADARRAYDLAQIAFLAAIGGLTDLLGTQE
jgi:cobalt-zinc-cadmium efflux system outer membrane protein